MTRTARSLADLTPANPAQEWLVGLAASLYASASALVGKNDMLPPMMLATTPEGVAIVNVEAAFCLEDKATRNAFLRLMLKQIDASTYCLASEAWSIGVQERGAAVPDDFSTDPRARSVFTIYGASMSREQLLATFEIDEAARPRRLAATGEVLLSQPGISGSLCELLRRPAA